MSLKTTIGLCALASAALIPVSGPARAYELDACNGKPRDGVHGLFTLRIDRCYTPAANAAENAVINYARDEWHKISGVHDRFNIISGDNNCAISTGDLTSELALVPANHPLIPAGDSAVALTFSNPCAAPFDSTRDGRLLRADVLMKETVPLDVLDPLDVRTGGRQLLMHELGHVLGAKAAPHENDEPAVMNSPVAGKFGAHNVIGVASGKSESFFPDDVQMVSAFHSDGGAGLIDAGVSAWHWTTADGRTGMHRIYPGIVSRDVCRGANTTVRYSNANLGKAGIPQATPITMRIMFSDNEQITRTDRLVQEFTFWGTQGFFGTSTRTITVPANTPFGTYFVGLIADPTEGRAEQEEGNNSTRLGLQIRVNC